MSVDIEKLKRIRREYSLRKFGTEVPPHSRPYSYISILTPQYTIKLSIDYIKLSQKQEKNPTERMAKYHTQEELEKHLKKRSSRMTPVKGKRYFTRTYSIPFRKKTYEVISISPTEENIFGTHQLTIMKPTQAFLLSLKHLEYHAVREAEFCFDFHTRETSMMHQFLDSLTYVRWPGKELNLNAEYFDDDSTPEEMKRSVGKITSYFGKPRTSRELCGRIYEKKLFQRTNRKKVVCRFEVVRKRPFFTKHEVHSVTELLKLPPIKVLERIEFRSFDFDRLRNTPTISSHKIADMILDDVDWQIKNRGLMSMLKETRKYVSNPIRFTEKHAFDQEFKKRVFRKKSFLM